MKIKKLNLVIGKRQIIIVALLITLSVAAFLNWQFATGDQAITVMDVDEKTKKEEENNSTRNYGEAELVNKNENKFKKNTNYIKQAKLDRNSSYDEAIENNNKLSNSQNLTQEERDKVIDQSINLTEKKNQQESIENQIKNKNFVEDCIAYIDDNRVSVVVKSKNLSAEEVAQIKDIVCGVTKFSASNIVITQTN